MRVFIDAMIYINYFATQSVESKILSQIETLIDQGKIKLVFPEITFDEVYRNSIEQISIHKKKITFQSLISVLPPSVSKGETYKEAKQLSEQLKTKMEELQKEYQDSGDQLMKTVESLKEKAEKISETNDLIEKAQTRRLLGKLPHPTKTIDGLGDGMSWELLLGINDAEKTIIVTEDGGWKNQSDGNLNALHPAMEKEWKNGTRGEIKLYHSLANFLKEEFPKVKVSKEDIEIDKKASQYNPSTYPVTYPVTYGPTGLTGPASLLDAASATLIGSITVASPFTRNIFCIRCHRTFALDPNFAVGVALATVVCPNCGYHNNV